ncbi:hypothetical protein DQ04_12531000 [Trypanosoma grayi]|uniref:hypothetical protein n=1 Tax=Trypanosoma grayi TaxID=71804 RepID=UPI0004F4831D|nr:hypothetical protein DQ04_12531000 [Trypanosoma grayi]KEG06731.1 hypothetical protein DQ04_12531000 [Trypanosoma grayi]
MLQRGSDGSGAYSAPDSNRSAWQSAHYALRRLLHHTVALLGVLGSGGDGERDVCRGASDAIHITASSSVSRLEMAQRMVAHIMEAAGRARGVVLSVHDGALSAGDASNAGGDSAAGDLGWQLGTVDGVLSGCDAAATQLLKQLQHHPTDPQQ